ncbi:hypothetical protein [Mycolicibacterium llatzerense]|uniref:hypothetical protein n=1 Tax=Mycolicibacterium llatzerense TaxID=280871 RepID=UPI0013A6A697|nr:hypothetical protein [Mycolicibacterium llatzerense]
MPDFDTSPRDASEGSERGVDPQLRPFIRRRIEETVEAAGHSGAEAQRLAAMVCASIDEFLPTRVQWGSATWVRVHNHTDRYLQTHNSVDEARRRLDEIARTESLHRSKDGSGILVRTGLLRRYRGEWTGVVEPNPLEAVSATDLASAADLLLADERESPAS